MWRLSSLLLLSGLMVAGSLRAETRIESGPQRVTLLELFTSEGCSSCPPAENWLGQFRGQSRLWKEVVPICFHVNYWDNLGWKDRLAKPEYTARQRNYSSQWGTDGVYTPGFVLNGQEWKGWFDSQPLPEPQPQPIGGLILVVREGQMEVEFRPSTLTGPLEVHIAPLAMQISSDVRAGENRGRKLEHNFVALHLVTANLVPSAGKLTAHLSVPVEDAKAIAAWVTAKNSLEPLQAAGGFLN